MTSSDLQSHVTYCKQLKIQFLLAFRLASADATVKSLVSSVVTLMHLFTVCRKNSLCTKSDLNIC